MVDRTKDAHGHWGVLDLDEVEMWIDQEVLMLRAVTPGVRDPVKLNNQEAMAVAIGILERVRAIEVEEGDDGDDVAWGRVAKLASHGGTEAPQ